MGKNITIQEGGIAKTFGGVEKIVTNVVGGGTQNWIPEEEATSYVETGELSVSENGTYYSSDEGYVGFSKVDVRVTEGTPPTLVEKEITENGTYNASDDDADGYSKVVVNITPPTPPVTLKDYYYPITDTGETINLQNNVSGCFFNGKLYAFKTQTQMYCLENGVWSLVATLPDGIVANDARLVVYNNQLYLFGASNRSYALYNQTWLFNGTGFEKITEMSGRGLYGAYQYSVYNGKVHFVGAASTSGGSSGHVAFDGTQWEDCPFAPVQATASAVFNNELYMFNTSQQKLYKFNGTTWAEVPNSVVPFKITNMCGLYEHKNKLIEGFTEKYNVNKLVYYEISDSVESAIFREKQLKKWKKQWKTDLIIKNNPNFDNISQSLN